MIKVLSVKYQLWKKIIRNLQLRIVHQQAGKRRAQIDRAMTNHQSK